MTLSHDLTHAAPAGGWTGQVVWITGASGGVGSALARAFSAQGAYLILSSRDQQKLEALRSSLPGDAVVVPMDLCQPQTLDDAVQQALAWQGRVDVLVNNAGVSQRALLEETSMATARRLMDVNFFGATALTQAVLPSMVARGHGRIVNMTSVASYVAAPLRAYYSASKHALRAWSNTLRAELGGSGVQVVMVCPGFVDTDISQRALSGDGVPLGTRDPQVADGLDPDLAAARMLPAIARGQREVLLGGVEIAAIYWQRFCPWIVDWVLPDRLPAADRTWLWHPRRWLRAVWGLPAPERD